MSSFFTALIGLFSFVSPFSRPTVLPSISRVKPFTLAAKMEPPPFVSGSIQPLVQTIYCTVIQRIC